MLRFLATRLRRRAWALAAIAVIGIAGTAVAFWSASGSGSAQIVLPDPQPLVLSTGAPTARLYPGGSTGVSIVAANSNPYFLRVASLQLDQDAGEPAPFAVDGLHSGCDVAALSFVAQDNDGAGWLVPPKVGTIDGTLTIGMPDALLMGTAAANACQGATFSVRLTLGS